MKCDVSWRLEVGAASGGDLISSVEIESTVERGRERERREKSLWDVTR
jgi:hypothetical protein